MSCLSFIRPAGQKLRLRAIPVAICHGGYVTPKRPQDSRQSTWGQITAGGRETQKGPMRARARPLPKARNARSRLPTSPPRPCCARARKHTRHAPATSAQPASTRPRPQARPRPQPRDPRPQPHAQARKHARHTPAPASTSAPATARPRPQPRARAPTCSRRTPRPPRCRPQRASFRATARCRACRTPWPAPSSA